MHPTIFGHITQRIESIFELHHLPSPISFCHFQFCPHICTSRLRIFLCAPSSYLCGNLLQYLAESVIKTTTTYSMARLAPGPLIFSEDGYSLERGHSIRSVPVLGTIIKSRLMESNKAILSLSKARLYCDISPHSRLLVANLSCAFSCLGHTPRSSK